MAKGRKRPFKAQKAIKSIPLLGIIIVLLLGIAFTVFDNLGILSYNEITAFLGLSDKAFNSEADVTVHYIDVGQGDSILIMAGNQTVLIDAGEVEYGNTVVAYIKAQGIEKLDYVIGSHPHSDHIGGLSEVIDNIEVGNIIMPRIPKEIIPTTKCYKNLLTSIKNQGLKVTNAEYNLAFDLGGIASLKILAPRKTENDGLNNYSVICKLTHGDNSFLFMGDTEKQVEEDLVSANANIDSDVLKVGHHGSNTSSSEDFLNTVSPQFCVIMVGEGNTYNHPNKKAVDRLLNQTNQIYRTDVNGTIIAQSDGRNIDFQFN